MSLIVKNKTIYKNIYVFEKKFHFIFFSVFIKNLLAISVEFNDVNCINIDLHWCLCLDMYTKMEMDLLYMMYIVLLLNSLVYA